MKVTNCDTQVVIHGLHRLRKVKIVRATCSGVVQSSLPYVTEVPSSYPGTGIYVLLWLRETEEYRPGSLKNPKCVRSELQMVKRSYGNAAAQEPLPLLNGKARTITESPTYDFYKVFPALQFSFVIACQTQKTINYF